MRLGRVLSFVQSQITGKDLNRGLSDTVLPWPLHGFLWALQPDGGAADSLQNGTPSLLLLHPVAGSWGEVQQDWVSPFKTRPPNVVSKWNTSCQIFLDILTTRRAEGSKAKSSTGESIVSGKGLAGRLCAAPSWDDGQSNECPRT